MAVKKLYWDIERLRREVAGRRKGATIARHLGVSANTVNRWLTGRLPLTLERFNQICELIGVDADEFIEIKSAA